MMMKTSAKVSIAILIGLSLLAFFARAELNEAFGTKQTKSEALSNALEASNTIITFNNTTVIPQITTPAYPFGTVAPFGKNTPIQFIETISDYLKSHNEKALKITGAYVPDESEIHIGGYKNIGFARAAFIANKLIEAGIASPRIIIDGQLATNKKNIQSLRFELFNDSEIIP